MASRKKSRRKKPRLGDLPTIAELKQAIENAQDALNLADETCQLAEASYDDALTAFENNQTPANALVVAQRIRDVNSANAVFRLRELDLAAANAALLFRWPE